MEYSYGEQKAQFKDSIPIAIGRDFAKSLCVGCGDDQPKPTPQPPSPPAAPRNSETILSPPLDRQLLQYNRFQYNRFQYSRFQPLLEPSPFQHLVPPGFAGTGRIVLVVSVDWKAEA